MRRVKLTTQEKEVETSLLKGEFTNVDRHSFAAIADAIAARRKDAVLNLRVNSEDLQNIKDKARRLGIKYQTFISELLHRVAHS